MTTQADLFAFLAEYVAPNRDVSTQDDRMAQWIDEQRSALVNSASVVQELKAFYAEYVAGTQVVQTQDVNNVARL